MQFLGNTFIAMIHNISLKSLPIQHRKNYNRVEKYF